VRSVTIMCHTIGRLMEEAFAAGGQRTSNPLHKKHMIPVWFWFS